jgi:hypothetical protein
MEQDACYRGSTAWRAREHGDPRQRRDSRSRSSPRRLLGITPEMTAAIPLWSNWRTAGYRGVSRIPHFGSHRLDHRQQQTGYMPSWQTVYGSAFCVREGSASTVTSLEVIMLSWIKQQSAFGPLTNCPFASPESAPERELRQGCDYSCNPHAIRKCLKSIFRSRHTGVLQQCLICIQTVSVASKSDDELRYGIDAFWNWAVTCAQYCRQVRRTFLNCGLPCEWW